MRAAFSLVSLLVVLRACDTGGPGAVGAPCNTADDCEGDLICDEHNGQASCQAPHDHGEDESASGPSTGGEGSSTSGTEPAETETSGATSTGAQASTGELETSSTGAASEETGADNELCAAFCSCMASTCAQYEAYPYADELACLSSCDGLQDVQLQCFGGFCEQATISEGSLAEHYCEHAWGDLGDQKC